MTPNMNVDIKALRRILVIMVIVIMFVRIVVMPVTVMMEPVVVVRVGVVMVPVIVVGIETRYSNNTDDNGQCKGNSCRHYRHS